MKLLVETTGDFQLVGPGPEQFVRHNRPSVVTSSSFMDTHMGRKRLRLLGQVSDEATDVEFAKAFVDSKGDKDLAVQAFLAEYPTLDEKAAETPAPKRSKQPPKDPE